MALMRIAGNGWIAAGVLVLCGMGWSAPELTCVCSSAPEPGSEVLVNADCEAGAWDSRPETRAWLFYSLDGQNSWTELAMVRSGEPGYDSTHEQAFAVPGSGVGHYYVRSDDGQGWSTQSPFNNGNAWPPGSNLLAQVAQDSIGDANNPEGPYLDLVGAYVGYSADRFYFMLTNNDTRWPTSGGLLKWFAYSLGLANPAAASDTWVFAPIYVSAWPVMEHGLFAINRYTGEIPERIGNIDYATDGNKLLMRCLISDMTGDPRFGPWPNDQGWLHAAATTQTITPGGSAVRDTTVPGRFYVRTPGFTVGQNRGPTLSHARVIPESGGTTTEFRFSARYFDADSNLAKVRSVVIDDDTLSMVPNHHRYWAGVTFEHAQQGFGLGWHRFWFRFGDGMAEAVSEMDSFLVTGTGVASSNSGELTGFSAWPNPFQGLVRFLGFEPWDRVEIWNSCGRPVRSLRVRGPAVFWNGEDDAGRALPAGVYFIGPGQSWERVRVVKTR